MTRTVLVLAGLLGALLLSGGCIRQAPPPPPQIVYIPAPAPVQDSSAPKGPGDNCGLDPADMDQKTKAQCGLTTEEPAQSDPIECSGNNVPVQSEVDGSWYCDYSEGTGTFSDGEPIPYEPEWTPEELNNQGDSYTGPEPEVLPCDDPESTLANCTLDEDDPLPHDPSYYGD